MIYPADESRVGALLNGATFSALDSVINPFGCICGRGKSVRSRRGNCVTWASVRTTLETNAQLSGTSVTNTRGGGGEAERQRRPREQRHNDTSDESFVSRHCSVTYRIKVSGRSPLRSSRRQNRAIARVRVYVYYSHHSCAEFWNLINFPSSDSVN